MEQKWDDFFEENQVILLPGYIWAAFPNGGEKHILDVVPDKEAHFQLLTHSLEFCDGQGGNRDTTSHSWSTE